MSSFSLMAVSILFALTININAQKRVKRKLLLKKAIDIGKL
jgi:hypothetical protein